MTYLNTFTELLYWAEYYYHRKAVVAGGVVRDMLWGKRPKDYDVFLLGLTGNDQLTSTHKEVAEYMHKLVYTDMSTLKSISKSKMYAQTFGVSNWRYGKKKVQIIECEAVSVEQLLATFDWQICQFAFTLTEGLYMMHDPSNTQSLQLTAYSIKKLQDGEYGQNTATVSLKRGRKFVKKFSLPMDTEHEAMLVAACQSTPKTL